MSSHKQSPVQELAQELRLAGISHNHEFQSAHERCNRLSRKGHWGKFLTALSLKQPMSCPACAELRQKFELAAGPNRETEPSAEMLAPPTLSQKLREDRPEQFAKGRPPKGADLQFDMQAYIAKHKPDIFEPLPNNSKLPGYPWWCIPCQKEVKFHRNHPLHMEAHEARACHQRACRALGL